MVAITWAYLKKVKLEQQAFATLQKSLKFKTELQANYLLQELKFKVSKLHYVKLSPDFKGQKTLALKLEPRSSTTPDYVLRRQFSQKQKMQMSWQIVFLEKMKPITLSCSATIIAKDRPWSITLSHADKL
ncbi:MAG: hypothetical protein KDD40_01245 [Bdellovibrionales bacterium]|nr:hypothetical protein [Bdellovibrionales bacterium]